MKSATPLTKVNAVLDAFDVQGILRRRAERQSIGYGDEVGFDYLAEESPGQCV